MNAGGSAEVGAFIEGGQEYNFKTAKEAERFTDWVQEKTSDAALTAVAPPVGWTWSGFKWLKNKITGNEYNPPAPDSTYVEGGGQVNGSFGYDMITGGASASARAEKALGAKLDHNTGDLTVYSRIELSAEGEAKLGFSSSSAPVYGVGASGSGNVELIVEMTVDSTGKITSVGMDGAATVDGAQNLTVLFGKPLPGGGKGVHASASFEVTDQNRDAVQKALVGVGALAAADAALPGSSMAETAAIPMILAEANKSGDISATFTDVDSQNLVKVAAAGKIPGIGGLGAGIEATKSSSETTDAYYFDGNQWNKWAGCTQ